jgi:hypothetical protein
MLKLVLNVEDAIRGDMVKDGVVNWLMGTGVSAKGTFKLFEAGVGVNAALSLETEVTEEKNIVVNNAAATANLAKLTGTVVRRITFNAGTDVTVDTKLPWTLVETVKQEESGTNGISLVKTADTITVKRDGQFTTPATIDVEIKNHAVATGYLADSNINSGAATATALKVLAVGDIHIDALCQWRRHEGLKPNETHFNMRADDPHTKVLALGEVTT